MSQQEIGNNFTPPMPVVLVGALVNGKANFMAVGWCCRCNSNPPMLALSFNKERYTLDGIRQNGVFSVCFPNRKLMKPTDYCGIFSGKDTDKSILFTIFFGKESKAPLIEECSVNLECRLVEQHDLPTNTLVIGEITGAYASSHILAGDKVRIEAMDPLILTMPDCRYWALDDCVGHAWEDGRNLA